MSKRDAATKPFPCFNTWVFIHTCSEMKIDLSNYSLYPILIYHISATFILFCEMILMSWYILMIGSRCVDIVVIMKLYHYLMTALHVRSQRAVGTWLPWYDTYVNIIGAWAYTWMQYGPCAANWGNVQDNIEYDPKLQQYLTYHCLSHINSLKAMWWTTRWRN